MDEITQLKLGQLEIGDLKSVVKVETDRAAAAIKES
jgi:hypothetical protein